MAIASLALLTGVTGVVAAPSASAATAPASISLSVVAGPTRGGTLVEISGYGVGATTRVLFGTSVVSRVTRVSSTRVRVVTPAHDAGIVHVRVGTPSGVSPVLDRATFAFDPVPTVTGLSVKTLPPSGGLPVTITGTGLTRATKVVFGTTTATSLVRLSPTQVRVTAPAHASGVVTVRVTTPGGTSSSTATAARVTYGSPPTLSSVDVDAGPLRGGTVVTITGRNLATVTQVRFGTLAGTGLVRLSDTRLRVTTPAQAPGVVPIRATNPNGTSKDTTAATFAYVPVPGLTTVTPPAGPLTGGTTVTVVGRDLSRAQSVLFGSTPGTGLVRVSATQVRVTAPPRTAGTVDVRVVTPGGSSTATAATRFTYQRVPTVTSVTPSLAPTRGGTVVTVTGTDFDRVSAVHFGTTVATTVTLVSSTQLRVVLPARPESKVDVRVTTPGGTSPVVAVGRFTFQDPPVVTALSPAVGPLAGGTVVTVTGTSLTDVASVTFGGVPARSVTRLSSTTLQVVVPARSSTGMVTLAVTTPAGATTRASAFAYQAGAALQPGQTLSPGTSMIATNGVAVATMMTNGSFVVWVRGVRAFATPTSLAGSRLTMRPDGSLAVLSPAGATLWTSGTAGFTGAVATLGGDGYLALRQGTTLVWDHRGYHYDRLLPGQSLRAGESLVTPTRSWLLTMRTDGNLVVVSAAGLRQWGTYTTGTGNVATMQTDGAFVVRSRTGALLWSTKTSGNAGSIIRMHTNANVVVYRGTAVTWAITGGPAPTAWSCYVRASKACIDNEFGYYGQRVWNYPVDPYGNNCTNYAAYRLNRDGVRNPGNLGNAATWDDNARAKGITVSQTPKVGAIAQWNKNHVAYVDWVSSDGRQVAISESGYGGTVLGVTYTSMSGRRLLTKGTSSWPSNFIHFR